MKYQIQNLTVNINLQDGDYVGDCRCSIPFAHKSFIKDSCGMEKNEQFNNNNYEPIFEHDYGEIYVDLDDMCYYTTSVDIIIMYMAWLLSDDNKQEINVDYENPFWAIHDVQHALYDEAGCTIYVNAEIEKERLEDALRIMLNDGYEVSYETIEEIQEAYTNRFNKPINLEEVWMELIDEEVY